MANMLKVTTFAPKMLEFFHIPTVTIISHPLLSSIEPPQSKFSIYIIHFGNKLLQCHMFWLQPLQNVLLLLLMRFNL